MPVWIALFRGVNVVGKNKLPMKELVRDLEALRLRDVRTYIQSGNAVFRSSARTPAGLAETISNAVERRHGFRPRVLLLRPRDLDRAILANPFPEAGADPKSLHLYFLASVPASPDLAGLEEARSATERFEWVDRVLYLHAPDGIGRSKLAARVERCLGVPATARNWRTVLELRRMTDSSGRNDSSISGAK